MKPTSRFLLLSWIAAVLTLPAAVPEIAAAATASAAQAPVAGELRQLDFDVLRSVRDVGPPVLSPEGGRVAYAVTEPAGESGRRTRLWIRDVEGWSPPRALTDGDGGVRAPAWSPDGSRLAYLSGRQVWSVGASEEEPPRQLTSMARGVSSFAWGPEGRRLAVVAPGDAAGGDGSPGPGAAGEHIHVVDLASGTARRLTEQPLHSVSLSWSPDGRTLAYSARAEPGFYGILTTDVFLLDVASGATRALVQRQGMDHSPEFSPDGSTVAFISGFGRSGLLPNAGIALVDPATGEVRDAGRSHDRGGFFEGPTRLEFSPDGGSVYSNASYGIAERIVRLDLATGATEVFSHGPLSHGALDVAASAPRMALLASAYDMPHEVHVTPLNRFAPERLTRSNPQLADVALPEAEVVRWRAPDGVEVAGLLVLPPPPRPAGPLPLLVSLHGGPTTSIGAAFPDLGFFYNPYRDDLLASRGYAVLLPNPRGSGGFGEEFRRGAAGDWGRGPLADVLAGVDHLVESGIADPDRLGVMGWSYGGYLAAWTVTATDRFRAASVGAGVFDLESHFGQAPEQMLEYFGGPPWEIPGAYEDDSPSSYVDRVTTPTQVIHGRDDTAVSPAQAEYLAASLRQLEAPREVLFYPGEGHSLRDPEVREESWRRVLAWFDRWLRPGRDR